MATEVEKAERLDRIPRDGYWYVLNCGCHVGYIDGQFLHRPPDTETQQSGG